MAWHDDDGGSQGPGHFAIDFLRAAEMIVADSNLDVEWVRMPRQRIMYTALQNRAAICIAGLVVTEERRTHGQFSEPFGSDRWIAAVVRKDDAAILDRAGSFAELASLTGGARLLAIQNLGYGKFQPTLDSLGTRVSYPSLGVVHLLEMVAAGRADIALVPETYMINLMALSRTTAFEIASYPDMERADTIAFWCSNLVPSSVVDRLNGAIRRLRPELERRFPRLSGAIAADRSHAVARAGGGAK